MIDPLILRSQRRLVSVLAGTFKPRGKAALSCSCGACRKCLKREWMRVFRAGQPKLPPKPCGPRMLLNRRCPCGAPIADKSRSGKCQRHRGHKFENIRPADRRAA